MGIKSEYEICLGKLVESKLILYTMHKCIPCKRIFEYLSDLGLNFIIKYIDDDENLREYVKILTGETLVPVLLNHDNGRIMIGCSISIDDFIQEICGLVVN